VSAKGKRTIVTVLERVNLSYLFRVEAVSHRAEALAADTATDQGREKLWSSAAVCVVCCAAAVEALASEVTHDRALRARTPAERSRWRTVARRTRERDWSLLTKWAKIMASAGHSSFDRSSEYQELEWLRGLRNDLLHYQAAYAAPAGLTPVPGLVGLWPPVQAKLTAQTAVRACNVVAGFMELAQSRVPYKLSQDDLRLLAQLRRSGP